MDNTTARASTPGVQATLTKAAMKTERNTVMEFIRALTAQCIKDIGRKGKDMEKEFR